MPCVGLAHISQVFIETLDIVYIVIIYHAQHGVDCGAGSRFPFECNDSGIVGRDTHMSQLLFEGSVVPSQAEEPKHSHITNLVLLYREHQHIPLLGS